MRGDAPPAQAGLPAGKDQNGSDDLPRDEQPCNMDENHLSRDGSRRRIYAKRSGTKRGPGAKDPNLGGCDGSKIKLKNLDPEKRGEAKQVLNKNNEKRF